MALGPLGALIGGPVVETWAIVRFPGTERCGTFPPKPPYMALDPSWLQKLPLLPYLVAGGVSDGVQKRGEAGRESGISITLRRRSSCCASPARTPSLGSRLVDCGSVILVSWLILRRFDFVFTETPSSE
jgi:hypothetical protein